MIPRNRQVAVGHSQVPQDISNLTERIMKTTDSSGKMSKCVFAATFALALMLPLSAGAGEKKWKDATLIEGPVKAKDTNLGEANKIQVRTKNWIFIVKVGDYKYVADVGRTGGLFNPMGGPKTDDWQPNSTIQVHFHHRAGSLYMDLKSPDGKKKKQPGSFSKVGPDGKQLCGKIKCTSTPEDED